MTAQNHEVARLTGKLVFDVESAGFQRFNQMLRRVSQQMLQLGKEVDKLTAKMAKPLKLKIDTSDADKAKAKLDSALKRQHRAEVALGNQQRQTFAAELSQQKLKYIGTEKQASIVSDLLKSQREAAVIAAKAHATQMRGAGITKQQLASQNAVTASMTKQARLAAITQKLQAATQKANNTHLASMTKIQRLQQIMNQAQTAAQQRAAKHTVQLATLQQNASNKATNQAQKNQRFQWQQQRQQVWQANQNSRSSQGSFGGMGGLMALGGIGGAIAALTAAANMLGNRIQERQEGVQEAQGFNNMFMSISKDPAIVKLFRDAFVKSQNDNGGAIDTDTAKDFRTLAINMAAAGKTLDQINDTWNVRQQAFSVAGTSKEDNKELNKQLGQMAADGTGAASDANIINDRMPMLTPYVVREYMKDHNITDYKKGLGAYNKDLKGGKGVKFSWYDEGMRKLVAANGDSLERNRNSVATAQQRADNQAYLNTNNINSDAELSGVIKERITAERELNEALQPLKQTLASFDLGLTKLATSMLRMAADKNPDGSEKTDQQKTQERMTTADMPVSLGMVGTHDYSNVDGNSQHQGGPIGNLWNWVLGIKDKSKDTPTLGTPSVPDLDIGSQSFKSASDNLNYQPKQLKMPNLYDTFSAMQSAMSGTGSMQAAATTSQVFNTPINVTNTINTTIAGSATEADAVKFMDHVKSEINTFSQTIPGLTKGALTDMMSTARAQQYEGQ
jgi:hypothetical protein